jgi:hypothetical protein
VARPREDHRRGDADLIESATECLEKLLEDSLGFALRTAWEAGTRADAEMTRANVPEELCEQVRDAGGLSRLRDLCDDIERRCDMYSMDAQS